MRTVQADFTMTVVGPTDFILLALPAATYDVVESLSITLDGVEMPLEHHTLAHATREVRFSCEAGTLAFQMHAEIDGPSAALDDEDPSDYLLASRYVEVDAVRAFADERFGNARGWAAVDAITQWIARHFDYRPALSAIDDSAVSTLTKSGGMCRDYAHVTIALCRARGIPARYVSVFAPHLAPADFHAVAEVFVDGAWWVVDATGLAPRRSMVRIATGRDALETAWATNTRSIVTLESVRVRAMDDQLEPDEADDPSQRIPLR